MSSDLVDANALSEVEGDDFLPPINQWINYSVIMVLGVLWVAGAITAFIKYNVIVQAPSFLRTGR